MNIQLHNTLKKQKEVFQPLESGKIRMYVCGPTVYDYIHIGNARPMIFFDLVRRYFQSSGFHVTYVVNFTDVDDKLIKRAEESGSTVAALADKFVAAFFEDADGLGVRRADAHPRVTDYIPKIVQFIEGLIAKGFAYESEASVYFRTAKFDDYGRLSGQNLDDLRHGARIEADARKQDAADFVLWKAAKSGEVSWASPWGEGRPGWHIECSVMSEQLLGQTFDIHGGGHDLAFPHHECERAQSEALHGAPQARYWMHNGYIHINDEKMAKSAGNSVFVRDLLKRIDARALRYFMVSTHYRHPLNFSYQALEQAEGAVDRLANAYYNTAHHLETLDNRARSSAATDEQMLIDLESTVSTAVKSFHEHMSDDFHTPDALTAWFNLAAAANRYTASNGAAPDGLKQILSAFSLFNEVFGLLPAAQEEELQDEEIDALIAERQQARTDKNWTRADEIRDQLQGMGIVLEDTAQGLRWRRK